MNEIKINLPAIDETLIDSVVGETTLVATTETEALAALRDKYHGYARHNGFVRTAWSQCGNSNYTRTDEAYLRDDEGRKVKAFLVVDRFERDNYRGDQNRGEYSGTRLYLTARNEWVELERAGHWSQWQGEGEAWHCGVNIEYADDDYRDIGGSIDTLTDGQVQARYKLSEILDGLSEQLKSLSEKLPERLSRVRTRSKLASELLAALK